MSVSNTSALNTPAASALGVLTPDWPAPAHVRALQTTRSGGISVPPYASFNLGTHVGDDLAHVSANRAALAALLPCPPAWLNQIHSTTVADAANINGTPDADASVSRQRGVVSIVMTADCLPLLFCNRAGTVVASAHAGWRGLCHGVIEATVAAMQAGTNLAASDILVWLGPAIGPNAFEVGSEVRAAFMAHDEKASAAFSEQAGGKWLADIYLLARQRLHALGITAIYGGNACTVTEAETYFSYRRDGQTGRMASLIWLD